MKPKRVSVLLVALLCLSAAAVFAAGTKEETKAPAKAKIGYITRLSVPWWIVCDQGFKDIGKNGRGRCDLLCSQAIRAGSESC